MSDRREALRRAKETAAAVLPRAIGQAVVLSLGDAFWDQKEYQDQLVREVLALADPEEIDLGSIELTSEQVKELKAKFEAVKHEPPEVLWHVTRRELRALVSQAYALGWVDHDESTEVRSDDEVVHTIVSRTAHSPRVLWALGIPVQEGQQP